MGWEGGWEKCRKRKAAQFSVLGLTVENERRGKVAMWLKGTEKGTTARVMSKCVE